MCHQVLDVTISEDKGYFTGLFGVNTIEMSKSIPSIIKITTFFFVFNNKKKRFKMRGKHLIRFFSSVAFLHVCSVKDLSAAFGLKFFSRERENWFSRKVVKGVVSLL